MKKVILAVMILMSLVGVAGAEEVPVQGQPLPFFDAIKDSVKFVRTQEESLQVMCASFQRQQRDYTRFNSTGLDKSDGEFASGLAGAFKAQAALERRRELGGQQADTSYSASVASVPSGFNAISCGGSYPTSAGMLTLSGGKILKKELITGDLTYQFEYGPSQKYPVSFTVNRGGSRMSGIKQTAKSPVVVNTLVLDFLKFDPKTVTYNSPDGRWSFAENSLLTFANAIERDTLFVGDLTGELAGGKRIMSITEAFQSLQNPDFQGLFLTALKEYIKNHRPSTKSNIPSKGDKP